MEDQYARDLESLLYRANHEKPEYEISIDRLGEKRKYIIKEIRELKAILEEYKNTLIMIKLEKRQNNDLPKR